MTVATSGGNQLEKNFKTDCISLIYFFYGTIAKIFYLTIFTLHKTMVGILNRAMDGLSQQLDLAMLAQNLKDGPIYQGWKKNL